MACILPEAFKSMEEALNKEGQNIMTLADWESSKRLKFFAEHVGERNAEFMNKQYERRIMGDYTRKRLLTAAQGWWTKGIPESRRKTIIDTLQNADIFNPADGNFLASLAKMKLGFAVDQETAKSLFDAAQTVQATKDAVVKEIPNWLDGLTVDEYNRILRKEEKGSKELWDYGMAIQNFADLFKANKLKAEFSKNKVGQSIAYAMGVPKSLNSTADLSFGRQLIGMLSTDPIAFFKSMWKGYKTGLTLTTGPKQSKTMAMAYIYAMPQVANGNARKAGVDIGNIEEAFPSDLVTKLVDLADSAIKKRTGKEDVLSYINLVERADAAYSTAVQTARALSFQNMYDFTIKNGGKFQDLLDQDIGGYLNSLTGRSEFLSKFGNQKLQRFLSNVAFAPKFMGATIERLYNLRYAPTDIANIVKTRSLRVMTPNQGRGRAALFNAILMTGTCMLAYALLKDIADKDELKDMFNPLSTNFMKVVIGNTTYDFSFGTAQYLRLAARIYMGRKKTISGRVKDINPWEEVTNLIEGKLNPALRAIIRGSQLTLHKLGYRKKAPLDFSFEPYTYGSLARDTFLPITVNTIYEQVEHGDNLVSLATLATVADFIGISSQVYRLSDTDAGKDKESLKAEKKMRRELGINSIELTPRDGANYLKGISEEESRKRKAEFTEKFTPIYDKIMQDKNMSYGEKKDKLSKSRAKLTREMNKKYK